MHKLWILLIALIIWGPPSIRFTKRSLGATLQDPTNLDLTILIQITVWLGAGIIVLFMLFRQILLKKPLLPGITKQGPARWYFIYGLMAVISTIYSVFPLYTLYFSLKIVIAMMLVGYWLMLQQNSLQAVQKLLKIFYLVFLLQGMAIIILYFISPGLVGVVAGRFGYRLTGGIFADYGGSALLAGLFFLNRIFYGTRKHRNLYFLLYLISWYFLLLSQTRSSITVAILFILIYVLLNDDLNKKFKWIWSFSIITVIIIWIGYFDPIVDYITRKKIAFDTLSGRTIAFSFLVERWKESPWIGYGFAAGVRAHLYDFVKMTTMGMGGAHDSLSKVLIDLGVIGLIPLTLTLIFSWKNLANLYTKRMHYTQSEISVVLQLICLLIMVSIQSVISGGIAALSIPFIIVTYSTQLIKIRTQTSAKRIPSQNLGRHPLLQSGKIS